MVAAAPWIAMALSAAGTAYAGNRANKANQQQGDQMKQQQALAKPAADAGKQMLQQGQGAMGQGLNYYSSMLANPREATAPEQNRIGGMYAGQTANVRNQMPRGGYGPAAAQSIRDKSNAAQENVIQNARPQAAQGLMQSGTNLASLGYQGMGLGSGILGNVFNQGLNARQQSFNQGSQVGSGLFNAYQSYLMGNALSGARADGGADSNPFGNFGMYTAPGSLPSGSGNSSTGSSFYQPPNPPNSGPSGYPPP